MGRERKQTAVAPQQCTKQLQQTSQGPYVCSLGAANAHSYLLVNPLLHKLHFRLTWTVQGSASDEFRQLRFDCADAGFVKIRWATELGALRVSVATTSCVS